MRLSGGRRVAGRRPESIRERPGQERAVRHLPWVRLLAVVGLAVLGGAVYWLGTAATFAIDPSSVPVTGTRFTSPDQVRTAMGLPAGTRPDRKSVV
jgi:cell division septal protein FtsQ